MAGVQDLQYRVPAEWDPSWFQQVFIKEILSKADTRNATGDGVTISGGPNDKATVKLDTITFAKFQDIATNTFLGRQSAGTGDVENLTTAQATALLDSATLTLSGVVIKAANVADAVASSVSVAAADATDLATVITLTNELKGDLTQLVTDLNAVVTQLNAKFASDVAAGQMA